MNATILRVASRFAQKTASETLGIGDEVEIKNWRIHRYRDVLVVTDLTFAGKRGKKVQSISISEDFGDGSYESLYGIAEDAIVLAKQGVAFDRMKSYLTDDLHMLKGKVTSYLRELRGVDVIPAGFTPVVIKTNEFYLEVTLKDFRLVDSRDQNNIPTTIPAIQGGKKDIPVFYRWVKDNEAAIKRMTFRDISKAMDSLGIKVHSYYAMD